MATTTPRRLSETDAELPTNTDPQHPPRSRHPRWVFNSGEEPDYRFSFANERTYLAWLRTAMALMAGGVAIKVVLQDEAGLAGQILAIALVFLGVAAAALGAMRWAAAERAMRRREPLPGFTAVIAIPIGLVLLGLVVAALNW